MKCVQDVDFCKIAAMPAIFGKQNSLIYIYISKNNALCWGVPKYGGLKRPIRLGSPPQHVG
nr:MAG TPA: hypothetical protein [Caudoviricetes sp.]